MKTWLLGVLAKRYLEFTNISSAVEKKVHHLKKSIPFLIPKTPSLSLLLLLLLWTVSKSTEDVDDELKQSWEVLKISLNATSIEALYFVSKKKFPSSFTSIPLYSSSSSSSSSFLSLLWFLSLSLLLVQSLPLVWLSKFF